MGVNSLPKTVTRQRRGCDLNPGPSAPESSTLTTRLPSHPGRQESRIIYKGAPGTQLHIQYKYTHTLDLNAGIPSAEVSRCQRRSLAILHGARFTKYLTIYHNII